MVVSYGIRAPGRDMIQPVISGYGIILRLCSNPAEVELGLFGRRAAIVGVQHMKSEKQFDLPWKVLTET